MSKSKVSDNDQRLNEMIEYFQQGKSRYKDYNHELEVKFGTKGIKPISKINFDNVCKRFLALGFEVSYSDHLLRIQPEFIDNKGVTKISNIRVELNGLSNIQEYCKKELIDIDNKGIVFNQKSAVKGRGGEYLRSVDYNDFNFRVSYNTERTYSVDSPLIKTMIDNWKNSKKIFRLINRVRLSHKHVPIFLDLSIVKSSKRDGRDMILEYDMKKSGVFNSSERYEIEFEVRQDFISNNKIIMDVIKKNAKYVLSGIQETKYPIGYKEFDNVLFEYMQLIHGDKFQQRRIYPKDFIGPSSLTLQVNNVVEKDENYNLPNIRDNYTVTEKVDGLRKLLYISKKGKIYLIDTNMNIQYTGVSSTFDDTYNSLLDGEHILHNKTGGFINLFAAFDIYYIKGKNVREKGFANTETSDVKELYRLPLLNEFIKSLNLTHPHIRIEPKTFYIQTKQSSIFDGCKKLLEKMELGGFEYETDGLIFTPIKYGVGGDRSKKVGPNKKYTWESSFKWKPLKFNTIDFLVKFQKEANGKDKIINIFKEGLDTSSLNQLNRYKVLNLHVGFDEKKDGYINPCQNIYDDEISIETDYNNTYRPAKFYPTNPSDESAHKCNIMLKTINSENIFTIEGEVIEDNMIVEFSYDNTKEMGWKWQPLRVRYDKTSELRNGGKNFGNGYHVANSNWHTIHNPITEEMISTGLNIPNIEADDDVYYNSSGGESLTKSLRDFHNLYVKKELINAVSKKGDTLIDFAVGKGGDFPKWIASKLSFVYGIDIARDNIENRLNGACARYLNYKKQQNDIPDVMFIVGNSGLNIKSGSAFGSDKAKMINNAIFGKGSKDKKTLEKGIYKNHGRGAEGFNVSSCQFAMHYFFENKQILTSFLENVSECTKIGGYFIGTCYDGRSIFRMLSNKERGESVANVINGKKIWEITKDYDNTEFSNDNTSVGYAINVYQETINKTFKEYLVNFEYLNRIMENYGFVLLNKVDITKLGLNNSSGMFNELYNKMEQDLKRDKRLKDKKEYGNSINMSKEEKQISFLNRYFIYKKVRNVDIHNVTESMTTQVIESSVVNEEPVQESEQEPVQESEQEPVQESEQGPIQESEQEPVQEEKKDALKEAEIILDAKSVLDNAHKDEQSKLLEQPVLDEKDGKKVKKGKKGRKGKIKIETD